MDDARARELLGVGRDAPPEAVRRAYRRLVRQHHPDLAGDSIAATRRTAELNQAYAVLLRLGLAAGAAAGSTGDAGGPPPPPAPGRPDAAERTPVVDGVGDAASVGEAPGPPSADDALLEVFDRLCEAADLIGSVTYVDRANAVVETLVTPATGPICSLQVTLEPRGGQTLAHCTLESLDARPGPPIEDVVAALTRALDQLA